VCCRCLLSQNYVRVGKWFVQPLRDASEQTSRRYWLSTPVILLLYGLNFNSAMSCAIPKFQTTEWSGRVYISRSSGQGQGHRSEKGGWCVQFTGGLCDYRLCLTERQYCFVVWLCACILYVLFTARYIYCYYYHYTFIETSDCHLVSNQHLVACLLASAAFEVKPSFFAF